VFVLDKSPVKVWPEMLNIFLGSSTLFIWTRGHISFRVVNVTWIDLHALALILHFLNLFWIASKLVCSFCEVMTGSLSVASTAVSSAKVAVVGSGEVGRSAVYIRYNNFFLSSQFIYNLYKYIQ
jgi:hypothetical protein